MDYNVVLDNIVSLLKNRLGDNLVGVYLHGSLAMGCFTEQSDIDIIVIINNKMDYYIKRQIIDYFISMKGVPIKGIEISFVLVDYALDFIHPCPFDLHYSIAHKQSFLNEGILCEDSIDYDLAAHFVVIKNRGKCLYGKDINDTFGDIREEYYIDSIYRDIYSSKEMVDDYIVLNLCRVLYYLRSGVVSSKLEGGKWGLINIDKKYYKLIEEIIDLYRNKNSKISTNNKKLQEYKNYMFELIEHELSSREYDIKYYNN